MAKKKQVLIKKTEKETRPKIKIQDTKYWANRPIEDKKLDWGINTKSWLDDYWGSQSHPHRKLIIEELEKLQWDSLLEIGCGCGANLQKITDNFENKELVGIDINPYAVKFGNGLLDTAEIIFGDIRNLSKYLKNRKFDVILSDSVLIYISSREIKKVLSEIKKTVKKHIIFIEWFDEKSKLGVVKDFHWARNYQKILTEMKFKDIVLRKLTEEEWQRENWQKNGYIITARLL